MSSFSGIGGWFAVDSELRSHSADYELSAGDTVKIVNKVIDVKNNACSADSTSLSLGDQSQASGTYSLCYGRAEAEPGKENMASGAYCINIGWHSSAIGNYSTVLGGNYCLASGAIDPRDDLQYWGPFAQGGNTSAYGQYSHSEGICTVASGSGSHAEGASAYTLNQGSHAEGVSTSAYGKGSHVEGFKTVANYNYAHAEGHSTYALSSQTHSEGQRTSAYGIGSHAEGDLSFASGACSHAEGNASYSLGNRSHAEGSATSAYGICSHSEGLHTIASADYSLAVGRYNNTTSALFVVGNGSYENNTETRSDILIVDTSSVSATRFATSGVPDIGSAIADLQAQMGNVETALNLIINGGNP